MACVTCCVLFVCIKRSMNNEKKLNSFKVTSISWCGAKRRTAFSVFYFPVKNKVTSKIKKDEKVTINFTRCFVHARTNRNDLLPFVREKKNEIKTKKTQQSVTKYFVKCFIFFVFLFGVRVIFWLAIPDNLVSHVFLQPKKSDIVQSSVE